MRLLHFSDIHIGMENYAKLDPETGLSTRLLDFFSTFDFIVETAIKENVDAVLFAGDAYKTRDPNPTQQRGFGERIKGLAKKGIPTVLVTGNHDTPNAQGKANTLDIYSALEIENVWVSRQPEFLKVPTKSGTLQVITLPWLHKNDYQTIAERLRLLYEKVKLSAENGPAVLVSHAEISGAQYGSEKGMAIANDVMLPLSLITDRRLSYVALGHIHKHQILSKAGDSPLVVYSGSPQRIDFGEEKEEKGICLVELTQNSTPIPIKSGPIKSGSKLKSQNYSSKLKFIPTNARGFLTITINLKSNDSNPTQTILDEIKKHEVADKIVRVIINIPAECETEIKIDLVKKALSKANFIAGISRNVERKERSKLEGLEEVESLTPIQALRKYFESKKIDPKKQKLLEEFAAEIFNT